MRKNGTSFSNPIAAGFVVCLKQQFPTKTSVEIIEAIRLSSSLYPLPDNKLGYGIPDFYIAERLLALSVSFTGNELTEVLYNDEKNKIKYKKYDKMR